jgi:hypothetical protein
MKPIIQNKKMHPQKWYKEHFGVSPLDLGLPFIEKKNPYNLSGPKMKLWDEDVVRPHISEAGIKNYATRSEAGKKSAETKKMKLLAELQSWEIHIEARPLSAVRNNAIQVYNCNNCDCVTLNSDQAFLDRITVNYIRHQLTDYEQRLGLLFGRVGTKEAYPILKEKILDAIAENYPELSNECIRQKCMMYDDSQ